MTEPIARCRRCTPCAVCEYREDLIQRTQKVLAESRRLCKHADELQARRDRHAQAKADEQRSA